MRGVSERENESYGRTPFIRGVADLGDPEKLLEGWTYHDLRREGGTLDEALCVCY